MKKIITGLLSLTVCLSAGAATVTPESALSRLNRETPGKMKKGSNQAAPQLQHTIYDAKGEPALYIFTYSGSKGFMILPADDAITPLLAYSETNSFGIPGMDIKDNPFIQQYAKEVEGAKMDAPYAGPNATTDSYSPDWVYIAPMVKALWNQFAPYNDLLYGNLTGCVATAMAELMKYWEYPERGTGTVKNGTTIVLDNMPFEWDLMLDTYVTGQYDNAQAKAVATLMKAVGWAMGLNYGSGATSGNPNKIPGVLIDNFLYAPGATNYFVSDFGGFGYKWNEALYNNLKDYGPVIYSDNDHTYICDGYDGAGLFHFNLGGSGAWDGWYVPAASHWANHGSNYNDYTSHQFAGNLRPATAELKVASATLNNVALSATETNTLGNISYLNLDLNLGFATPGLIDTYVYLTIAQGENVVYKTVLDPKITQQYGNIELTKEFILPALENGTDYTLSLQYQKYGSTEMTNLAAYTIQGTAETVVNPWEGVPSVDVTDGTFTIDLTGLTPATTYTYTLYAVAENYVSAPFTVEVTTQEEEEGPTVGIGSLINADEPARYFNLQGMEIAKPAPGTICIVKQGDRTFKTIIK